MRVAEFTRLLALVLLPVTGCAPAPMQIVPTVPTCRAMPDAGDSVRWVAPDDAVTRRLLASWCETVGPPGFHRRAGPINTGATLVVTWNLHAGAGDVRALLTRVRADERAAGRPDPNVILLLQEAIRIGAAPGRVPSGSPIPRRISTPRADVADIMEVARLENLNAVYFPSMRNGREGSNGRDGDPEDRGNAILSTLPLADVAAIELPFSAQRRVAVSARIADAPVGLRVVSLHFDTFGGHGRQAAALADALARLEIKGPLLVAGDFNSAMKRDAVIRSSGVELRRVACSGATHKVFQLDHVMTSGISGSGGRNGRAGIGPLPAVSDCVRLPAFGSDHTPLKVTLSFPNQRGGAMPFPSTAPGRRLSRK
jgi:endonuclease/exonuclease/phosphatase family metal-dependent hydrolase